ncbi:MULTISPECIES: hypothetical protein [unclassified Campylobacter]|uniref:hypothetical protein n=1 Tax=unclassified Campylobacter TaxID=2593542 RepID=UPI0022E9DC51|nr:MULTISPECIES: hypothetical protein [unclassified Campylobacter]MDA3054911.1 hypothetical protein [Campylobacter sp. VBCF_07 NA4]MDA3060414.1 hypothetical protein [Campylobacter sp. VBCF_02 NA5]MDA3070321.1 hypothetical protein [Campylobacter sp. VBCF_08 NA3]WBR54748.1 hypothetical protein PF027_02435 [Campylobacter sp. VBCF_01 NA2]
MKETFETKLSKIQKEFKEKLLGIQPALKCLQFLYDRTLRVDYRGTHKLQHYRWNKEFIKIVLKNLPKEKLLYHTKGDIHDDYKYKPDEYEFCEYLTKVNKELEEIGSNIPRHKDMVMRKILFVNLQRMGFIDRFALRKNGKIEFCNPNEIYRNYRYVKINNNGLKFLNSKDIFEEQKILGVALDNVFNGLAQDILDILNSLQPQYITVSEMMFFVTYLGREYQGKILTKDNIVEFINEFRSLKARRKTTENVVSEYCDFVEELCDKFKREKTDMRDFHNWKNESQTMFNNFNLMSLFEHDEKQERLLLKTTIKGEKIIFKRSSVIKEQYFKEHNINKNLQFELHHIVPFYYAKDIDALKAIDDWKNLIYIDANSHKLFTLDKKIKNAIRLNFRNLDAVLDNLVGDEVVLKYTDNIKYKVALQDLIKNYNKSLLGEK